MTLTTKLMAAVAVVLCGWMAGWQLWHQDTPTYDLSHQATMQQQIDKLKSEMVTLQKAVADYRETVKIYKHAVLASKGPGLNEEQDIAKMLREARVTR